MKKRMISLLPLCLAFCLTACSPAELVQQYLGQEEAQEAVNTAPAERTYMDELTGTLTAFDGNSLTLTDGAESYTLDVSQCSIETEEGIISGDQVSLIYEGLLENGDTAPLHALKLVDQIHKKEHPEEQVIHGTIQAISDSTLTLLSDDKQQLVFSTVGVRQSFAAGLKLGTAVYLRYKGSLTPTEGTAPNASLVRVLSISDTESWQQVPTAGAVHQFRAHINSQQNNLLRIRANGSPALLNVDLSEIPCSFDGGTAVRSGLTVYYTGTFDNNSLGGITIIAIVGDDFETFDTRKVSSSVIGTIIGTTANTLSLRTNEGAFLICNKKDVPDSSTTGLAIGSSVRVVFDPKASRTTNILASREFQDV